METRAVEEDVDKAAKEALANLRGSISVPGLDPSSVVDKYCEVEFKESLDNATTPEKREEMKKKFVDYYIVGPGKSFIDECISQIQFYYKQAKEGLESLQTSVAKVTASNAIPSVLTTGAATSTANPAWTVIENSQKKNSLASIIKSVTDFLSGVLRYCILLHFEVPSPIMATITLLGTVSGLIDAIPG